jgi:hypothetical protein
MQAPQYEPTANFYDNELNNQGGRSTVGTALLDGELEDIAVSINALQENQELNQRDDGEIRDQRVKMHTLADDVLSLIVARSATARGTWVTATLYTVGDWVINGTTGYLASSTHTSAADFVTDLVAGKWLAFTNANQVFAEQYGATTSGADSYTAIMNAVTSNPNKTVLFGNGYYSFSQNIIITNGARLVGNGTGSSALLFTGADGDAVTFAAASTASTSDYMNGGGIDGLKILRTSAATTGAGLRMIQCNGFHIGTLYILDFPEGLVQEGGKEIRGEDVSVYLSATTYPSVIAGSSLFRSRAAAIDGGLWQSAFTATFSKITLSGGYASEVNILLERADGLTFGAGYCSAASEALVRIQPHYSGGHVSGVSFGTVYMDGINQTTGTVNGVEVLDDGFAGASIVNNIDISGCLLIGNFSGKGLYSTHPNIQTFTVDPGKIINCAGTEIDITSGDTGADSWIGVPLTWTPTLTCATPGDLAISAYTTRTGRMLRTSSGMVHLSWDVNITAPNLTHTTASGALWLSGAPITTASTIGVRPIGSMVFGGITKATFTQFTPYLSAGSTTIEHWASGSGVGLTNVAITDIPTGGTVILRGSLTYPASELG